MSEDEKAVKKRKGVSGWRAFFLMFGCGTIAAFVVMGIIVGGLRLFVSSLSGGGASGEVQSGAQPTREPVTSMTPGAINLCVLIDDAPPISLVGRLEGGWEADEIGPDGNSGVREVVDECSWEFIADGAQTWEMDFSYRSLIEAKEHDDRFSVADSDYKEKVEEAGQAFEKIESEGVREGRDGEQYYYFGEAEGGVTAYSLIRKVKSSVYVIELRQKNDDGISQTEITETQAADYANNVASLVDNPLRDVVPD